MIYYLLFFFLVSISLVCFIKRNISSIKYTYLFLMAYLLFLIIGGGRNNVGSDWPSYKEIFENYSKYINYTKGTSDVFFYNFNNLIAKITNSFNVFVFLLFFLSFTLKYYVFSKYSANIFYSLAIYLSGIFLIFDINGLRQGLAFSFIFAGFYFLLNNKKYKFFISVLLATLCHSSSLVFAIAYFFKNKKLSNKQYIYIAFFLAITGYILSKFIGDFLVLLMGDADLTKRYAFYAAKKVYTTEVTWDSLNVWRRFILWFVIVVFTKNDDKNIIFFKNCMLFSFFLFFLFSSSLEVAYRISYYFFAFEIFLIPYCIAFTQKRYLKISLFVLCTIYYFYMTYKLISDTEGGLTFYNNIFY